MQNLSITQQIEQMVEKNRNIDKFVDEYVKVLNNKTDSYNFYTSRGRRYIKITEVVVDRDGKNTNQVSVHCFVDKNPGLVYKAAGWNAPQKAQDMIF